jgi:type I site-specific restriction endonuclease
MGRDGEQAIRRRQRPTSTAYNTKDFDRTLVLDDRTKLVARKITDFLENADLVGENYRYVMRIVGGDTEGEGPGHQDRAVLILSAFCPNRVVA